VNSLQSRYRSIAGTVIAGLCFLVYSQPLWDLHFTELEIVLILLVASFTLGPSLVALREAFTRAWPLWAFLALVAASPLWSDFSWAALDGAAVSITLVATALVLLAGVESSTIVRGIALATVAVLLMSLTVVVLDPATGLTSVSYQHGALRGIYSHRNTLGYTLAIGLPALVALAPRATGLRVARILAIVLVLGGVAATRSATALVAIGTAAIVAGIVLVVRRTSGPRGRVVRLVVASVGCALVVAAALAWTVVSELLGRNASLTGRTVIWDHAWKVAMEQPVLGYGWNSVWAPGQAAGWEIQRELSFSVSHPHSSYLEVLLTLGFVGLAALVWMLADASARSALTVLRDPARVAYWFPLVVIITLVYAVPETMLTRPLGLWLLALVLMGASRWRRRDPSQVTGSRSVAALSG
jgi:O-antigen ligase